MIVIDEFITDQVTLRGIETSGEFHMPKMWGWWDGWWTAQASNYRERVVQYIWGEHCPFAAAAGFPNSVAGFEYWTLAHQANPEPSLPTRIPAVGNNSTSNGHDRLSQHRDRDESLFARTGELRHPRVGAVYYPINHHIEGGYLKIYTRDTEGGPFELIEPHYNRLVIFDSSVLHEVTPVTAGRRYALAINVWDYPIQHPRQYQSGERNSPES